VVVAQLHPSLVDYMQAVTFLLHLQTYEDTKDIYLAGINLDNFT
jgi:hypothetical protein